MHRASADMPVMSMPFRLRRMWNEALDWVYPGAPSVCVLCHRVIPPMTPRQLTNLSAWAETAPSLGQFICPFCLQEAKGVKPDPIVRRLAVPVQTSGEPQYRVRENDMLHRHRGGATDNGSHGGPHAGPHGGRAGEILSRDQRLVPVYSVFRYDGFVQRAIRPWKYDGALGLTSWFAASMGETIVTSRLAEQVDFVVPVPTSLTRLRQRGYHHTLALANAVGRVCHLDVIQALRRGVAAVERHQTELGSINETQTSKSAEERRTALIGAFSAVDGVHLRGSRVLLLDDVVTTGATMQSCAEQLLGAGASRVVCIVIADVD